MPWMPRPFGEWTITRDDLVFADDDGVLFVPAAAVDEVLLAAEQIRDTERAQAEKSRAGTVAARSAAVRRSTSRSGLPTPR